MVDASKMESGVLVKWQVDKGFGFIKRESGGPDIFCHISQLSDTGIKESDKVSFVVEFDSKKGRDCATQVRLAIARTRCRYGAACYRKNPEHLREFAHLGDPDWDTAADSSLVASSSSTTIPKAAVSAAIGKGTTTKGSKDASKGDANKGASKGDATKGASKGDGTKGASKGDATKGVCKVYSGESSQKMGNDAVANVSTGARLPCRHGKDCYRNSTEHRQEYSHPGDDDWADACKRSSQQPSANDSNTTNNAMSCSAMPKGKGTGTLPENKGKGKRHCCQYGRNCLTQGKEHRQVFAHPGDQDWIDPVCDSSSSPESAIAKAGNESHQVLPVDTPNLSISAAWLNLLTSAQLADLAADLETMSGIFELDSATLVEAGSSRTIRLAAKESAALEKARHELCKDDGVLAFYESQAGAPVLTTSSVAPETSYSAPAGLEANPPQETQQVISDSRGIDKDIRIDPDDGQAYTFERLFQRYQDVYKPKEIKQYWQTMLPLSSAGGEKVVQKW